MLMTPDRGEDSTSPPGRAGMNARRGILEGNLERLLRRAYAPALARPQFRSRLERAIAARLSPARTVVLEPRGRLARRVGAWAAAAAALITLAVLLRPRPADGPEALLARGTVAAREEPEGRWRSAPADASLELRGFLELATPAGASARVDVPARGTILVQPDSRVTLRDLGAGGLLARLDAGRLVLDRSAGPPWSVDTAGQHMLVEERHAEIPPPPVPAPAAHAGPPAPGFPESPPAPALARRPALRGQVVDAAFRRPIERFTVAVLWSGERRGVVEPVTREFQDPDGRFEIESLGPGPYAVFVLAEGLATWKTAVTPPAEVAPVLGRGADVHGVVRNGATGDPIAGALVISETDAPVADLPVEAAAVPSGTRAAAADRRGRRLRAPQPLRRSAGAACERARTRARLGAPRARPRLGSDGEPFMTLTYRRRK